jgi:hypothetical protein
MHGRMSRCPKATDGLVSDAEETILKAIDVVQTWAVGSGKSA